MITFSSCDSNRFDIDISNSRVEIEAERLGQDMFESNPDSQTVQSLTAAYGDFFRLITSNVLGFGPPENPSFLLQYQRFISDPDMRSSYEMMKEKYGDVTALEKEYSEAFSHYNYYFPDSIIPRFVLFHSGFNYSVLVSDSVVGVGLERYLGPEVIYYKMLSYPQYITRRMDRAYIVPDAVSAWLTTTFEQDLSGASLLEHMIYHGKLIYLTKAMMPDAPDSLLTGYSQAQLDWARENETAVWAYIIDRELLYSVSLEDINKMTADGPFTPGMPKESPGGAGRWTGWRIVSEYMNKNQDVQVQDLMQVKAATILRESGYRP